MSIKSAVGYSENIDESYEAGLEIGDMILEKISLQANSLGILFCHIEFDFTELLKGIREKLDIPIFGCTTAGEANSNGYFEESASLLVVTSDDLKIGMGVGENLSKDPEAAVLAAYTSARSMLGEDKPRLAVTLPDTGLTASAEKVLSFLKTHLDEEVPMVGGLPADNFQFKRTYQFCNNGIYSDSIPLLLLAGNIEPLVITRSGWIPIGKKVTATKTAGNVLYEIDHQPAINYLKKYIHDIDDPNILASCPLVLLDETPGAETEKNFVIRTCFRYNQENGAVICNGDIPENAAVRLARGSRDDILAGVEDAVTTLRQKAADKEIHALLCFSCVGRRLMLGLDTKKELELVVNKLPASCAVNGFYGTGEIGPIDSSLEHLKKNKFHNTTIVLCAF
ncbi:MAG: hypothetical protein DKINENOH_01522 [bacterium]|nr:hypothetical protein [bacterium]